MYLMYGYLPGLFHYRDFCWRYLFFFVFGIEEIPHPIGAIVFHAGGIAGSLGIGFFSLFPLLIIHQLNSQNISIKPGMFMNKDGSSIPPNLESDDWELATEEELQTGGFEIR